jgi:DnaK suppressor protein
MGHNGKTLRIEKLTEEREHTLLRLTQLREVLRSTVEPEKDEGDFELEEHEMALLQIQRLERQLESIDGALRQVQQGSYGICERCREPIDPARLEAVPEATLCLNCKMIVERQTWLETTAVRFDWYADDA